MHSSLRRQSRQPPTLSRQGDPGWITCNRQPLRTPSSAIRPTQVESPQISATSAHSPGESNSTGRRQSWFKEGNLCEQITHLACY
jgi:hypothetical protein